MARLNLDFYNGTDCYSDGDVEDIILHIVENNEEYTKYKGTNDFFPILYHLSPERENILNWYPFSKKDNILEIGAGCGAITGALCRLCANVTCIELSQKRSKINYLRNRQYDNLEIIVGNFEDITIDKKFDYVILNGVFEYAMSFINGSRPYVDFLLKIKKFVNDNGKILMAIENRIGIKYFAGDMEDHTSCSFLGLNNYIGNNTVRTFSKAELEEIFEECEINNWNYYYPYPDYKFPTEIFTDCNVNSEKFGKVYRKYAGQIMNTFDEISMISTLKKEGVMNKFVNSFLVEIELKKEHKNQNKIEYVKLNNYRRDEFRIATVIWNNKGIKTVKKFSLNDRANKHINNTFNNQFSVIGTGFIYNQGVKEENAIVYPFLCGDTLDAEIEQLLQTGDIQEIIKIIDNIYYTLLENSQELSDIYCKEFVCCFGNKQLSTNEKCITNCNIDLIFDNLFRQDNNILVIDPEWVCNFAIPFKFVVWRTINELYASHPQINQLIPLKDLFDRYEISDETAGIFSDWAVYFATRYVADVDLDEFIPATNKIDKKLSPMGILLEVIKSSLYIDYGNGYSEADKKIVSTVLDGDKFENTILLDKTKMIYALRWDPVEKDYCKCHVDGCTLDGKIVKIIPVNSTEENKDMFLNIDPQFSILIEPGKYSILKITGTFSKVNIEFIDGMIGNMNDLLTQSKDKNGYLKDINASLKEENAQISINYRQLEQELKSENTLLKEENKKIWSDYQQLEQEKNFSNEENIKIKIENEDINRKMYVYYTESMVLTKELKDKITELHSLEKQNNELRDKYKKVQGDLHDVCISDKELRLELEKISDELQQIKESKEWKLIEKIRGIFRGKRNDG